MALEDAVILAKCLRDCPDAPSAFATFESLRRERVERIVKHGNRSSSNKAAGPIARVLRDLMLPIFFRRAEKDDGKSMMWLQGHHIDFAETVVPVAGPGDVLPPELDGVPGVVAGGAEVLAGALEGPAWRLAEWLLTVRRGGVAWAPRP